MIISLVDADMIKYHQTPFNLDLMKLATYYKKQKEIVKLTPFIDTEKFSKIIYRKDYDDGEFVSNLLMHPNVEYGGRAFSRDKYIALPPSAELCVPDKSIYNSMSSIFCTNKINTTLFNQMSRAQHLRLSLDGTTTWDKWEKQIDSAAPMRTFIFHDYDLGAINGAVDIIKDIYKLPGNQTKYIGMKFPVQLYEADKLMEWTQFNPMALFYNLQYNGMLTDEELVEFVSKTKGTSIASQTTYNFTYGCSTQEEFIANRILPLYRQIVFLRSNRCEIRLTYDDTIFSDRRWARILDLFIHYYKQALFMSKKDFERIVPFDSLYSFVSSFSDKETYRFHFTNTENGLMLKDEARDLFKMIKEEYYDLFKDFYECHTVELKGGNFQYE